MSKRLLHISRSSHRGCSGKKELLKINVPSKSLENTSEEVQLPHSYLSRTSAVSFNDFIDCHHRYQLLISASLSQIIVTYVIIDIIIMGFVFLMISFFFQSYAIAVIILETSSWFSAKMILTVLENISPSNHLILNVLFSRIQSQF